MKLILPTTKLLVVVVLFSLSASCGRRIPQIASLETTDVVHTPVKRQSIGNCWLYAAATMAESLHYSETNTVRNLSESYWTYWDWYSTIRYAGSSIDTGGSWYQASRIIARYGWMEEGDFIESEKDAEMSLVQANAERIVNRHLSEGGSLESRRDRTPENILKVLDEAFGVDMAQLSEKVRPASEFVVGRQVDGTAITLDQIISTSSSEHVWQTVSYPSTYQDSDPESDSIVEQRREVMRRVMKALNDRKPVVINVMVDFNALKTTPYATFDLETLKAAGTMGIQGGHLLVLEDYTVSNAPGIGDIGEGDMPDEVKLAALDGDLTSLKAKNSWGSNRTERGLTDGYTSFNENYLNGAVKWRYSEGDDSNYYYKNPLNSFILPPGY